MASAARKAGIGPNALAGLFPVRGESCRADDGGAAPCVGDAAAGDAERRAHRLSVHAESQTSLVTSKAEGVVSATITWRPCTNRGIVLPVYAKSAFTEVFSRAFGDPPWTLSHGHVLTLNGILAAMHDESEALQTIIDGIETHNSVCIEVAW